MSIALCQICKQPMPEGEQMFQYHGYSSPCPIPVPIPTNDETHLDGCEITRFGKDRQCSCAMADAIFPLKEKELTPEEWREGLRIIAEGAVTIPDGNKQGRWDRESRVALVYSVLCSLARNSGAPI